MSTESPQSLCQTCKNFIKYTLTTKDGNYSAPFGFCTFFRNAQDLAAPRFYMSCCEAYQKGNVIK